MGRIVVIASRTPAGGGKLSRARPRDAKPLGLENFVRLAWLGASIGTVAGALRSRLQSIDEIREAAYGHNQRRRSEDDEA